MEQQQQQPVRTVCVWAPPNYTAVIKHYYAQDAEFNEVSLQKQEGDLDLRS